MEACYTLQRGKGGVGVIEQQKASLEDVQRAYPGCPSLALFCDWPNPKAMLEKHSAKGHSVDFVLRHMKVALLMVMSTDGDGSAEDTGFRFKDGWRAVIAEELDTPDARRYIAARLGAM